MEKQQLALTDFWCYFFPEKEKLNCHILISGITIFLFALVLAKECHYFTKNQFSINGIGWLDQ